jgi:hypothetical protein
MTLDPRTLADGRVWLLTPDGITTATIIHGPTEAALLAANLAADPDGPH